MFEEVREGLLEAVRGGATVDEAARSVGVSVHTVRSWLSRGRKTPVGPYGAFAVEVDRLRRERSEAVAALDGPLTLEEAERVLAVAVRRGSIAALRLWFDRCDREEADDGDVLDEFVPRLAG